MFVLLSLPTVTSCSHVVVATEIQLEESTSGCSSVVVGESDHYLRFCMEICCFILWAGLFTPCCSNHVNTRLYAQT